MQAELNSLDEAGGSVKVEGKFIAAGITDVEYKCSGKTGQKELEKEQSIEFLDILIEMGWEEGRRQMITGVFRKKAAARMFKCLTRTENLGEIIRSGGNRKSNDDDGGNEGLREEEDTDEPEWSGGMVGESVLADMELEARLRGVGEEFAPEAGGR